MTLGGGKTTLIHEASQLILFKIAKVPKVTSRVNVASMSTPMTFSKEQGKRNSKIHMETKDSCQQKTQLSPQRIIDIKDNKR